MDIQQSFMPVFIALGWISGMLLLGALIRAKIGFFQRFLLPACLIGGIIGFILISFGVVGVPHDAFALIAFHLFSLGFISVGLTGSSGGTEKNIKKTVIKGSLWMALIWTASLSIQSLTGAGILFGLNKIFDPIYEGLGFLVGHGFTQGPGQALAISGVWQNSFNIPDAVSFGLAFAAVGFFIAAFIGVPIATWGLRKGASTHTSKDLSPAFIKGVFEKGKSENAGKMTTHPANIDGLAFQLALLLGIYGLTYFECLLLKDYIFTGVLTKLTFGFIFIYGLMNALIFRAVLNKLKLGYLIDDDVQRRITGFMVDFMIVSVFMAVKVTVLWKYIIQILSIVVCTTLITVGLILYFGRRAKEYALERTVAIFGYCTGTAASGLLLLRIVDPNFKTPVALEVGFMNAWAVLTVMHVLFLATTVPSPDTLSVIGMMGIHAVTAAIMIILLKVLRLSGAKSY